MEIPVTLGILLTFFLPFVNAAVQKVSWSPTQKNLVAIATSAIFAILYLFFTGGLDLSNIPLAIAAVYGLQQAIYAFLVRNIATKFEAITTNGSVVVTPSEESGKVEIVTDDTISDSTSGSSVTADPPVEVYAGPPVVTETPETAPAEPVEIVKDKNVVG